MLMIKLGKAGSHLSASRARSRHYDQRLARLNILIMSVTFLADYQRNVVRVSRNQIMTVHLYAHLLQAALEHLRAVLPCEMGNTYASHIEILGLKHRLQAQQIGIIGNSQISPHLVLLNVLRADHNHNLHLIGQLHEHPQLAVRLKARQYSGSMIIIVKLPAEFQVKFIVKLADALPDMLRLHLQIFFVVKSFIHSILSPSFVHTSVRLLVRRISNRTQPAPKGRLPADPYFLSFILTVLPLLSFNPHNHWGSWSAISRNPRTFRLCRTELPSPALPLLLQDLHSRWRYRRVCGA